MSTLNRWKCESYCLCGSRKGHFVRADDGVWILYEDIERLQQELRDQHAAYNNMLDKAAELERRLSAGSPCNHDWEVIDPAMQKYVCRLCHQQMPKSTIAAIEP